MSALLGLKHGSEKKKKKLVSPLYWLLMSVEEWLSFQMQLLKGLRHGDSADFWFKLSVVGNLSSAQQRF